MEGDKYYEQAAYVGEEKQHLTKDYVKSIAEFRDTSFVDHPVLYVVSRNTQHEHQIFSGFSSQHHAPPIKVTHLCLADGDGNVMYGRLGTQIADQGKQHKRGDILRLDIYTMCTHHIRNSPNKYCNQLQLCYQDSQEM